MIFTECPYCDEPQAFCHEAGDPTGFFPSRCYKCNNVMWVEATCIGGKTRTHDDFKKEIMEKDDESAIEQAMIEAENHSCVVYDA